MGCLVARAAVVQTENATYRDGYWLCIDPDRKLAWAQFLVDRPGKRLPVLDDDPYFPWVFGVWVGDASKVIEGPNDVEIFSVAPRSPDGSSTTGYTFSNVVVRSLDQ